MTPDEIGRLEKQIDGLRNVTLTLVSEVSALKTLIHSPGECDLKPTVRELKSWKDKVNGQGVILAFLIVSAASVVGGLIVKLWK
mgnify:CR=1 FL=1